MCQQQPRALEIESDVWRWLNVFESEWDQQPFPDLADFLQRHQLDRLDHSSRCELLAELVMVDLERRWKCWSPDQPVSEARQAAAGAPGATPRIEAYLDQFDELRRQDDTFLKLVREEHAIRHRWGDRPGRSEYLARFPRHAAEVEKVLGGFSGLGKEPAAKPPYELLSSAPPSGSTAASQQLVDELLHVGIFSQEEYARFARHHGDKLSDSTREQLLHSLSEEGLLTPYQVAKVQSGDPRRLVIDDYLVLHEIGAGGMGIVLQARHRTMGRNVAIKVIAPRVSHDREAVRRFRREIRTAAKLSHPNIVMAYDARTVDDELIFVMEYIEGDDLQTLVRTLGPLPWKKTVQLCLQVAKGLEYAHQMSVIHRDIKPANLLLTRNNRDEEVVKILDLGLAALNRSTVAQLGNKFASFDDLTASGAMMGTVDFMAPEQAIDARTVDERSDIYSLGCTLYYLLTGAVMYPADTAMQRILAHRDEPLPSLRDTRPDMPPELVAVFQKMVAKRQHDRYATMTDVIDALGALLEACGTDFAGGSAGSTLQPVAPSLETISSIHSDTQVAWFERSPEARKKADERRRRARQRKVVFCATTLVCLTIIFWRLLILLDVLSG